jgi:hypothetical protein
MIQPRIALRSLKHLCTFIGAIALFSYFFNLSVDTRHWFITLASAFVCSILWVCFYMFEVHRDAVSRVLLSLTRASLEWFSHLRSQPVEPTSPAEIESEEKLIT